MLEYRPDGAPDQHFQATGVELDDVARALSEWFHRGRRAFIAAHEWERLSLCVGDEPTDG